jgi:hypothetical protein
MNIRTSKVYFVSPAGMALLMKYSSHIPPLTLTVLRNAHTGTDVEGKYQVLEVRRICSCFRELQ